MRKNIVFTLSVLSLGLNAQDAVVDTLWYADNFIRANSDAIIQTVLPKSERVTSSQGEIKFIFADNVPDSIQTAVNVAGDIWRQYLDGKANIIIDIKYDVLENDIETEVTYFSYSDNTEVSYPASLYKYLFPFSTNDNNNSDGGIYINSGTSWDCSFSADAVATANNMTYAAMRSIANVLGFGASIKEYIRRGESKIYFNLTDGHSVFDNLIFSSDGTRMKDIPNPGRMIENAALREFIQPTSNTEIYALLQSPDYRMYAPSVFEPFKSLVTLNNASSLMHHNLNTGNKIHQIDNVTTELLREIGWYSQVDTLVNIISTDIDSTGIASAYSSHGFTIEKTSSGTITDARWEYRLPLVAGGDSLMLSAADVLTFEIPIVSNEELFCRNVNGDIYGRVIFSGKIGEIAVEDVYTVSLELKPKILYVSDIRKVNKTSNNYYDLYFTVCYTGANSLTVTKEEEGDSFLRTQYAYEPFLAHVKVVNVSYDYWAWVDITAENNYGKDVYTIELPAEIFYSQASSPAVHYDAIQAIDVYDISGKRIKGNTTETELQNMPKGLYILKYTDIDGSLIKTVKFINK